MSEKHVLLFEPSTELADNAMLKVRPELFKEWDFKKNDELGLDIYKVTHGSSKKAWWICEKGHPHFTKIQSKTRGIKCHYCSNSKVLIGFNDIWTTNPELASQLEDSNDGYKYTQGSQKRMNWKCKNCNQIIKGKTIAVVSSNGLFCPSCSDNKSYPEKFIYYILKAINIDFKWEMSFKWSDKKRYDFYIPSHNLIVEVHGAQHYTEAFTRRTLKEEKANDSYKKSLAYRNGIEKYIVIDARISDKERIKEEVLNSFIGNLIGDKALDWDSIDIQSNKSILLEVCKLFDENKYTVNEIARIFKISRATVTKYLKRGSKSGICSYTVEKAKSIGNASRRKRVVQLSIKGEFIKEWDGIELARKGSGIKAASTIVNCCTGLYKQGAGYVWMWSEDYKKYLKGERELIPAKIKTPRTDARKVVQLDCELNYIKEWESIASATEYFYNNGVSVSVSKCCSGIVKTTGGFKWMHKKDYEELIKKSS